MIRPAVLTAAVPEAERRAGEGVVLGLGETRSRRCLAESRCLGSGWGRAPWPCRESREEDEEERERERMPLAAMQGKRNQTNKKKQKKKFKSSN